MSTCSVSEEVHSTSNINPMISIDPDEFALATSPCLHSLAVPYAPFDMLTGEVDFNPDAR
jgi:hypothetical protein